MSKKTSPKKSSSKKKSVKPSAPEVPAVLTEEQPVMTEAAVAEPTTTDTNETPETAQAEEPKDPGPRTYELIRISKYGDALYRLAGVRGTVAITKSMFAGAPPATIVVDSPEWAAVGDQPHVNVPTPERLAKLERIAKQAKARAEKAASRFEKAASAAGLSTAPSGEEASL